MRPLDSGRHPLSSQGPGVALRLDAAFEYATEVVSRSGKLGLSADKIGVTAGRRMAAKEATGAFAGPYRQDQLILPFAIAGGGTFTSVKLGDHCRTAADIAHLFTGKSMTVTQVEGMPSSSVRARSRATKATVR